MIAQTSEAVRKARVLVVGAGGLGGPIAWILAEEGIGTLGIVDDDLVEASNLHRQIQFCEDDVGSPKIDALARRLSKSSTLVELHETRFTPKNARELVDRYDLVVEGSDNFATKFLTAETAVRAQMPAVQASSIRWVGTVVSTFRDGCYACLFEEIPEGAQESCDLSGVMGPVVGLTAAIAAELVIRRLRERSGDERLDEGFRVVSVDGARERPVRERTMRRRAGCSVCGTATGRS